MARSLVCAHVRAREHRVVDTVGQELVGPIIGPSPRTLR